MMIWRAKQKTDERGPAYERWAKVYNLKQMAAALQYLKLSYRERILIFEFIMRDLKTRDKLNKDVNVNGQNS